MLNPDSFYNGHLSAYESVARAATNSKCGEFLKVGVACMSSGQA
jgi:hypothetical protein